MLTRLLLTLPPERAVSHVVSVMPPGSMAAPLAEGGIPVDSLRIRRGVPDPRAITRLRRIVRASRPDLLQTWMYHADLLGGVVGELERVPVVWNVRHSNLDAAVNSRSTRLAARACAAGSRRLPRAVIYCSHAAERTHVDIGYSPPLSRVLPNGFDLNRFTPGRSAREAVRAELSVPEGALLVGLVARYHPQKDHRNFIRAAALFSASHDAVFVLVGAGCDAGNRELAELVGASGYAGRFRLLGQQANVERLVSGFDVAASSSIGEGFPNAIGEAMASGIPCVVTDVGDSSLLVGDTGLTVPPSDPEALARGWSRMAELGRAGRAELGARARRRIEENFSIEAVSERYAALWDSVLRPAEARSPARIG